MEIDAEFKLKMLQQTNEFENDLFKMANYDPSDIYKANPQSNQGETNISWIQDVYNSYNSKSK